MKLLNKPLIGILSIEKENRLLGNRSNFIDIIKTGNKMGALVFVFTPTDIDWSNMKMNGRFYNTDLKQWHRQITLFPVVVYNRIPNRDYEAHIDVSSQIQKLQQVPNLHLFNPHFFDKWDLFQILRVSKAHHYLPETKLLTNSHDLTQFMNKHQTLYLKPTTGKAGNGIYRMSQHGKKSTLSSSSGGKIIHQQVENAAQLWQLLMTKVAKKIYLAQQAIPLLTYEKNPFDIRVLVQKNSVGEWDVSGIGFRVAGHEGITTHVPQGGKIIYKRTALDPYFGVDGSDRLISRIKTIAVQIAAILDHHYESLGEMSMDFGVTPSGEIWFFEANAKPMKFDEPSIRKTSLRRIIEYSKYLAQFA